MLAGREAGRSVFKRVNTLLSIRKKPILPFLHHPAFRPIDRQPILRAAFCILNSDLSTNAILVFYSASYAHITKDDLYDCLALRTEVFVLEQDCPYQEIDGKDRQSWHIWSRGEEGVVSSYARILEAGVSYPEVSIGRVVVHQDHRGKQLGRELMVFCLEFIRSELGPQPVRISAQDYLLKFYESLGFKYTGKSYLEDGIPHSDMLLDLQ